MCKFQGRKYSLFKVGTSQDKTVENLSAKMIVLHFDFRLLSYYLRTYDVLSQRCVKHRKKTQNFRKNCAPLRFIFENQYITEKYYAVSNQIIFTIPLALQK